ncbi:MAG: transporter substrate-binding domain-containing protein [Legionella sp.]|nr:transporter substrate-binding domain-containing protein [Legionella sp.]
MKFKRLTLSLVFCFSLITSQVSATPVRVGTVLYYPPYVLSMNEGFDIDLIRLLFQRLKLTYNLVPMDFNKLFTALDKGEIDIAIAGILISPDKEKKYIFSLPYMLSKAQFLILNTSPVKSITDLKGKQVGVIQGDESGGVFYNFLLNNYSGLFNIVKFPTIDSLITSLTNGSIAAAFAHKSTADYWLQNGGNQFKELGSSFLVGEGIAIMSTPANALLIQNINQQLELIEKDDSYINLYTTYFGNN